MANTQTVVALDISAIIPMMIDIMMLGAVVAVMVPKPKQNLLTAGARTNLLASRMPAEMPKGNLMHAWMAQGGKGKTPWGNPRTNDAVSVTGRREGAPRSTAESRI